MGKANMVIFASFLLIIALSTGLIANAQPSALPNSQRPLLYVTCSANNYVTVIDTSVNYVVSNINVGANPAGVAVSPDGTRVYVANMGSNGISVIDTNSLAVIANIPVGMNPYGVVVNPAGNRLYVSETGGNKVSIIDTNAMMVINSIPVGTSPLGMVMNNAGTRLYVAESGNNSISVIDTTLNTVVASITTTIGGNVGTSELALNGDGSRLYAANGNSGSISVIDTNTNMMIGIIAVPNGAGFITFDTVRNQVLTTSGIAGQFLSVIDPNTNTVLISFPHAMGLTGLTLNSPANTKVYVASATHSGVLVLDVNSNYQVMLPVPAGRSPVCVAINPAGDFVPPSVSSTIPAANANNVPVNGTVSVTFSEPMNMSSIDGASFTLNDAGGNPVQGSVGYAGGNAVFTPSVPLSYNTQYTASMTPQVRDIAGNHMAMPFTWSFVTQQAPVPSPSPSASPPSPSPALPSSSPSPSASPSAPSPSPSPSPTATPSLPSPSPTPKATPGFEAIIAIGVLGLMSKIKRKR